MTVIHMQPVGWNVMTPRQWGNLRELIAQVHDIALARGNPHLWWRANMFLAQTEGRDV